MHSFLSKDDQRLIEDMLEIYHIIPTRKHGMEIWALIFNGKLVGTFMSEWGARQAQHTHKLKRRA